MCLNREAAASLDFGACLELVPENPSRCKIAMTNATALAIYDKHSRALIGIAKALFLSIIYHVRFPYADVCYLWQIIACAYTTRHAHVYSQVFSQVYFSEC